MASGILVGFSGLIPHVGKNQYQQVINNLTGSLFGEFY